MDKKHNFDAENNQTNELEEAQNANFYLTKLILHFEEINKKILELFKIENYDRFYEINKLTEEKKGKFKEILQEIPKNFEKEISQKLTNILEKYQLEEKLKLKTEAKIYSIYMEELKLKKENLGLKIEAEDESRIIKHQIKEYLQSYKQKNKMDLENLSKERELLRKENNNHFIM
jgi:hypothetical protein